MASCEIEDCLAPFNEELTSLNTFVLNAFRTGFLLIGYFAECFYELSLTVKLMASIQIVLILTAFIYLFVRRLRNPKRFQILQLPTVNAIPWLGSTFISLIFMVWILLVAAIQIAFDLVWLSSVSTTLIAWHVWVEFPLAAFGIFILVKTECTWREMFILLISVYSGFFLNVFLVSLTSNPYIQGSLGMLALLSDFMNPIIYAILTYRLQNKTDKIRIGLMEGVFISHLLNFYLPLIFCFNPWIMAVLYVTFQSVNFVLTLAYVIYEIYSYRDLPIPSIF